MNLQIADLLQDPGLAVPTVPSQPAVQPARTEQFITVAVSGSKFRLVPLLYQQVMKLPWIDNRGVPSLNTSPDVFEELLQFFLKGTMPNLLSLTRQEAQELRTLAGKLDGAQPLIQHVDRWIATSPEPRSSSLLLKSISSSFKRQPHEPQVGRSAKADPSMPVYGAANPTMLLRGASTPNISSYGAAKHTINVSSDGAKNPKMLPSDGNTNPANFGPVPSLKASGSGDSDDSSRYTSSLTDGSASNDSSKASSKARSSKAPSTRKQCQQLLKSAWKSSKRGLKTVSESSRNFTIRSEPRSRPLTHEEWCTSSDFVL